jgi:hypothetical protein
MANYRWILNEQIHVISIPEEEICLVMNKRNMEADGHQMAILSVSPEHLGGDLMINNKFVDVGDSLPQLLGIMDAAQEADGWIEMWPDDDEPGHDCPKDRFLEDPITTAYGVGSEMVSLIPCPVCDARSE